jgi:hypothetical protein
VSNYLELDSHPWLEEPLGRRRLTIGLSSIRKIREKLASQRKQLDEVETHLDEMEKAAKQSEQQQKL